MGNVVRFRRSSALTVAAVVAMIPLVAMGVTYPLLLLLLIIPLAVAVWSWRSGTDAGPDGLRVRAALGSRHVRWSDVSGFVTGADGRVQARLRSGRALPLTAVSRADLPTLVAASGHDLLTED